MNHHPVTELAGALRALGEHGDRLTLFQPAIEDLDTVRAELGRAHRLLAVARASLGPVCQIHPDAPPDPTVEGGCMFCVQNQRRGQAARQPAGSEVAPVSVICRSIVEEGHEAAVRRFGARAVTRAIVTCRNDPEFLEESA